MVAGQPPFYAEDPMATYEKILGNKLTLPDFFSKVSIPNRAHFYYHITKNLR
jgi:hypothetical protein